MHVCVYSSVYIYEIIHVYRCICVCECDSMYTVDKVILSSLAVMLKCSHLTTIAFARESLLSKFSNIGFERYYLKTFQDLDLQVNF